MEIKYSEKAVKQIKKIHKGDNKSARRLIPGTVYLILMHGSFGITTPVICTPEELMPTMKGE